MDLATLSIKHKVFILTTFTIITIVLGFFLKDIKFDSNILKLIPKNAQIEQTLDIDKSSSLLSTIVMFKDKKIFSIKKLLEKLMK
ncbi:putative membrane spanning protein [Borrelia duttonii CR2A]|uniref:Putative membrane spanning protein n=1 Tax=Borrelia duttonii CR2A TaxID=1432657 RepID=W6TYV4_9SPIR|nr:putative membrane spanning protein [Borrelia duttonii CR2A]